MNSKIGDVIACFTLYGTEVVAIKRAEDYIAHFKDDNTCWGCGANPDEALGSFMRTWASFHPDMVGENMITDVVKGFRELISKATPGPWVIGNGGEEHQSNGDDVVMVPLDHTTAKSYTHRVLFSINSHFENYRDDALLIIVCINTLPKLLDTIVQLQDRAEQAEHERGELDALLNMKKASEEGYESGALLREAYIDGKHEQMHRALELLEGIDLEDLKCGNGCADPPECDCTFNRVLCAIEELKKMPDMVEAPISSVILDRALDAMCGAYSEPCDEHAHRGRRMPDCEQCKMAPQRLKDYWLNHVKMQNSLNELQKAK